MSHLRNALLAGVAIVTLGGAASLAQAQTASSSPNVHVMTVRTPDGTLEQIRYTGDVAPRVVFVPVTQMQAPVTQMQAMESPFAMLDRISAEMDRQMAMMMQDFPAMMAQPAGPNTVQAAFGALPAGSGVCMRSISVTFTGNGQNPHVVRKTAGDCGPAAPAVSAPTALPETVAPRPKVPTIEAKDVHPAGQPAYRMLVIPAAYHPG